MSGIFDQIINYSPPLIVSGTVNYKGTWNASTNNPPLSNPPVASTKGDYYVVSTAGTQFSISFAVGDWIISSGTAWEKVDLTDAVSSVFGRTGAVVGVSTDYSAVGLTNTAIGASSPSTGAFTTVTASSTIAATGAVTGSNLSGTNTGDQTTISGNAGSATILQTARNINGVSFNGSADITVAAAAGTLTGNTLASGVTASSLTSVGTIASLVATTADINGGTIDGTTVGATTPSTVAATTLTASGQATLSTTLLVGSGATLTGSGVEVQAANFQIIGRSSSTTRMMLAHDGTKGKIGTLDNQSFDFLVNNAIVGTVSSTGLNSTAIGATTPSTAVFTTIHQGTAGAQGLNVGFSGAAGQGFTLRDTTNSRTYFVTTETATGLQINSGANPITLLGNTNVTGALSATGNGTFGGGGVSGTLLASNAGVDTTAYTAGSYNANHRLWLGTGNATNAYAAIRFSGSGGVHEGLFGTVQNASGNAEFFWNLYSGSSYVERLRLSATGLAVTGALSSTTGANFATSSGNVGIGTASPITLLNIGSGSGAKYITLTDTSSGYHHAFIGKNGNLLQFGDSSTNTPFTAEPRMSIDVSSGNVGIGTTDQFGGGVKVVGLANATTVPASNPTGGGVLYVESGALKYRGSGGTVTTIANA